MTLESLLPPPPWVSPPRLAGPQWGHCALRTRRARPEQLLGLTPAASPTRRGHRWGAGVPPQGGGTNPPQARARRGWAIGFAPSPSPPGRAGLAVPSLPGQRRQLWGNDGVCPAAPGCERRGRLLPPSKTGPAGRGAFAAAAGAATPVWAERTPLPPDTCPAQPAPSRPGRPRTGRCRQGPPGPGRCRRGERPESWGGAGGTWRSRSSEGPGGLGTGGAVSPLVPTGCPRPCCPLLTSPHCVPCPAPHPVLADGPRPRPRRLQPLCPGQGTPKVQGPARGLQNVSPQLLQAPGGCVGGAASRVGRNHPTRTDVRCCSRLRM